MLVIRAEQMKILNRPWQDAFRSDVATYLEGEFPTACQALGPAGVNSVIEAGILRADGYGIELESDVCDLIGLMVEHGTGFEQLAWAARIVGGTEDWDIKLGQLVGWAAAMRPVERRA